MPRSTLPYLGGKPRLPRYLLLLWSIVLGLLGSMPPVLAQAPLKEDVRTWVEAETMSRRFSAISQYRPLSEEEKALKIQAEVSLTSLRQRYESSAVEAATRLAFQAQTKERAPKISPASQAEWLAQSLPTAEQLTLDLADPRERTAAAFFFFALLEERVRPPFPAEVESRSRRYQEMLNSYGNAGTGNRAARLQDVADLSQTPEFQIKTAERYVPGLTDHYRQKAVVKQQLRDQQKAVQSMANRSVALLVLVVVLPWVIIARRSRPARTPLTPTRGSAVLPPEVGWIDVPSRRYAVAFTSGVVISKEVWTETTTHTHQAPGTTTMHGNIPIHTPGQITTSTSTKLYHRYWLRHPDGSQGWNRYTDAVFLATVGQSISTISYDARVLVAYNAATRNHAVFPDAIKAANSLPLGAALWLPLLVSLGGAPWVIVGSNFTLLPAVAPLLSQFLFSSAPVFYGFGFLLYLGIIKLIYRARSHRAFRRKHLPQLLEFMKAHTQEEPPVKPAS